MVKKKVKKIKSQYDLSSVSYTLGIASIIFAFFQPVAAIILGIIGFTQSKKIPTDMGKRAKKLNLIGIILGALLLIITIAATIYGLLNGLGSFPVA